MFEVAVVEAEQCYRQTIKSPGSCQMERILSAAGVGALVGIGGFAGGPVIGVPPVALGATGGAVLSLLNCAFDLKDATS